MRAIAILAFAGLASGCTSTLLLEPRFTLSPYYAIYQLSGDASVQTDPGGGGPLQNNPRQGMDVFGLDTHENDVGFRAEVGDGFGGLRVDYYQLGMSTSRTSVLSDDWGMLRQNDLVRMKAEMDELRISYVEPLFSSELTWQDEDLILRFGAGGQFTYRDMTLRTFTDDLARQQNVPIEGQTIAAAVRFRAEWLDFSFDVDYAISPHLVVRGDIGGVGQDIEMRASYAIPLRDVTFFAGYRYSTIDAVGKVDTTEYDADLTIDGFQLGVTVSL